MTGERIGTPASTGPSAASKSAREPRRCSTCSSPSASRAPLWATSTSWAASTSARTETGLTNLFHRRTPPAPEHRPTRFALRRVLSLTPGCERVPGPSTHARPGRSSSVGSVAASRSHPEGEAEAGREPVAALGRRLGEATQALRRRLVHRESCSQARVGSEPRRALTNGTRSRPASCVGWSWHRIKRTPAAACAIAAPRLYAPGASSPTVARCAWSAASRIQSPSSRCSRREPSSAPVI
jgi:hypothetical protein